MEVCLSPVSVESAVPERFVRSVGVVALEESVTLRCGVGGAGWNRGVFVCGFFTALRKNRARPAAIRIHCGTVTIPRLGLTILETQIIQKFLVPVRNVHTHTAQRNSGNRPRLRAWVSADIKTSSQVLRGPGLCSTGPGTIGIVSSCGRIPCLW